MQQKLNILIIEDNNIFHNILAEILPEHSILTAKTANEGLESFRTNKPDIVLLDIALPDGNGQDLLLKIRDIDSKQYVVMMTASRLKEDILKAMQSGAQGYIIKPFSRDMIEGCIKEFYEYKASLAI